MLRDGWHKYLDYFFELPDPLRHAISVAAREEQLVPSLNSLYRPLEYFRPEETKVVFLFSEPDQIFSPIAAWSKSSLPAAWQRQGVLPWAVRATMVTGKSLSHAGLGWEQQTANLLTTLSEEYYNLVWVLVGPEAAAYRRFLDEAGKHRVFLVATEPTPELFEDINDYLVSRGRKEVEW